MSKYNYDDNGAYFYLFCASTLGLAAVPWTYFTAKKLLVGDRKGALFSLWGSLLGPVWS